MNDIKQLFDKAYNRARQRSFVFGTVGKLNPDTSVSLTVDGRKDYLWVTLADKTAIAARNEGGVPHTMGLEVKLRVEGGSGGPRAHVIVGRSTRGDLSAPTETPPSGVLPHLVEEHSDVVLTGAAAGDVLVYDGADWIDETPVVTSAGAGDAGKLIRLDAAGHVDATMINDIDVNLDNVTEGVTNKFYTSTEKTKLAGIETGADVTDAANVGAAIDGVTELDPPTDATRFAVVLGGALRWVGWDKIKTALNLLYGRLAAANTWVRQQFIDGSANEIQLRVQGHSTQTTHLQTWESSAASVLSWIDLVGRYRGDAGAYLRNAYFALVGESTADGSMTGMYDRNELVNAALRGTVTVTVTGAGTFTDTAANKNNLFDGSAGNYFEISGTDGTTTQIVIHVDLLANQAAYGSANWQPFVQYRLAMGGNPTYYNNIVVEVSTDNATWYKPTGSLWETTDANAAQFVPSYWFGASGWPDPLVTYRYIRFTLTDRVEVGAYGLKDRVWIAELGLRHRTAPWARQYPLISGAAFRGDLLAAANGVLESVYNWKILQSGAAIFNEQGADVDYRIEGDNDPNLVFVDASTDRVGHGTATPQGKVHILEATLGNEVFRLESEATNDNPTDQQFHGRAATTNNTATTTNTLAIAASNTYLIEATAIARRTGGSSGTAEDAGFFEIRRLYKTVAGVVTLEVTIFSSVLGDLEPVGALLLLTISSTNVLVQVQGVTNYNITWHTFVRVRKVGT